MGLINVKWKGSSLKQDASNRLVTDSEKTTWNNKANNIHTHTKSQVGLGNVDNTADKDKSVNYANSSGVPQGFASRLSNQTWGNQNGTPITDWHTTNGGDIAFRDNDGQINVITDGFFYQNEGANKVLDEQNYSDYASPKNHTHNYAGSSSAGGSATSAVKLDTATAGSATQPVYFSGGKPVACSYTLGKSVPSNAVFTDTNTWIAFKGATTSAAGTAGYAPAPSAGAANRYLRSDGTWSVPPDNNTVYTHPSYIAQSAGLYKITVDSTGHVSGATAVSKADITGLGIPGSDTNTWRPLGTTADSACAGNDSRLSNARPASDVYAWAKASSKPSYSWSEITNKPSTFNPSSHNHDSSYIPFSGSIISNPNTEKFSISKALSGYLLFANTGDTNGVAAGIGGVNGANDGWSVRGYQTAYNSGCLEISVGDDGDEGIYVRQYTSGQYKLPFMNKAGSASGLSYREIVLMEPNTGNSIFPGTVTAKTFKGTLSGNASSASTVAWSGVTGKPSTFTPSSHTHAISEITNLQSVLNGKAKYDHNHDSSYIKSVGSNIYVHGTYRYINTFPDVYSTLDQESGNTPTNNRPVIWYNYEYQDSSNPYEDYCDHYLNIGSPNSGNGDETFGVIAAIRFRAAYTSGWIALRGQDTSSKQYSVYLPLNAGTLQVSSSDSKLKTNIKDTEVNDAISFINKIHLHSFDWKTDDTHQSIGFIADELKELDERLSVGGNSDKVDKNGLPIDPKCVNTFYLQGYEVKAIQELSSKIDNKVDALEKENKELKDIINQLLERVTTLENK